MFQSTQPHRLRQRMIKIHATLSKFQSTQPHRLRRGCYLTAAPADVVSIHAATRAATSAVQTAVSLLEFQST